MKVKSLLITLTLAMLLSACSELFLSTKLYSPQAISDLVDDLKILGENYLIEEVIVMGKDAFADDFGQVDVYMRDNEGQFYLQGLTYKMGITDDGPIPRSRIVRGNLPHAINIDDISNQKENIEKYVEAAKVQFKDEFESKYKFKSIGKLQFRADETGNLQIQFSIFATEKGKTTHQQEGRRIVITYSEFVFNVDKDGTVVYKAE